MLNEEKFQFNIDNIKNDLAMEGMSISEHDVDLYRKFASQEIDMSELIEMIKSQAKVEE